MLNNVVTLTFTFSMKKIYLGVEKENFPTKNKE